MAAHSNSEPSAEPTGISAGRKTAP